VDGNANFKLYALGFEKSKNFATQSMAQCVAVLPHATMIDPQGKCALSGLAEPHAHVISSAQFEWWWTFPP